MTPSETARAEARRDAGEHAVLRHVATLVARGVPARDLFRAVAAEVGRLLGADLAGMIRYEDDGTLTVVADSGGRVEVGSRWPLEGSGLATTIRRTGRPARIDDWTGVPGAIAHHVRDGMEIACSVGTPIVVEARLWGALLVHSRVPRGLPPDTERRLAHFTELVATGISNAQARAEVRRLADEQAALRRVATLVARQSSPAQVFAAVAEEVGRLLRVDDTKIYRYEVDGSASVVADWSEHELSIPVGTRLTLEGESVAARVLQTERHARMDEYAQATGSLASYVRELGIRSAVGTPIVVEGRLWGVMIAASRRPEPLPAGIELRIGEFTELVATAISNVQARTDLAASRARIVAATDEERRRVVRDLHDGAQQRLVHTVIMLKLARRALQNEEANAPSLVSEALDQAESAMAELRELAHGILPWALTHGGLRGGVDELASRMPVPVEIDLPSTRLATDVEATAYFVVAEALTNVAKHSQASRAWVTASVGRRHLDLQVRDDGVGGARPDGSGLLGLGDRLAVLDGRLRVESPSGGGTLVAAAIPLSD